MIGNRQQERDPQVPRLGSLLFLRGAVPAASQVRWSSLGALAAVGLGPLREFLGKW